MIMTHITDSSDFTIFILVLLWAVSMSIYSKQVIYNIVSAVPELQSHAVHHPD